MIKTATLDLHLVADSGYECSTQERISPDQWGWISKILGGCVPKSWEFSPALGVSPITVSEAEVKGGEAEEDMQHAEDIGLRLLGKGKTRVWKYHCNLCHTNFNSPVSLAQHRKDKHGVFKSIGA